LEPPKSPNLPLGARPISHQISLFITTPDRIIEDIFRDQNKCWAFLTQSEIHYLETPDNVLKSKTNLRRVANFFNSMGYTFRVERGYMKYIPWSGPTIEKTVKNEEITGGGYSHSLQAST
jgi:hypothetical protein